MGDPWLHEDANSAGGILHRAEPDTSRVYSRHVVYGDNG